jgi:TonB family protein
MKTSKKIHCHAALAAMVLSVIVIALLTLPSCGKTTDPKSAVSGSVTPPPPVPPIDSVYVKVDKLPVFTGGDTTLLKFLAKNSIYPESAKKNGIQGRVLVKLVVEKDGSVSNVGILEGLDPALDAEAVRVVSTLPAFEKPGILNGQPVKVHYIIPILFKLN